MSLIGGIFYDSHVLERLFRLCERLRGDALAFGAPPAGVMEDSRLSFAGSRGSFAPCLRQHLSPFTENPPFAN